MHQVLKVAFLGAGSTGAEIAAIVSERPCMEVVAVVDRDPEKVGRDLATVTDGETTSIVIADDADVIAEAGADVAVVTTGSRVEELEPQIVPLASTGINVVSLCEELAYPWLSHPELSARLDAAARDGGATILGTGCNPGYVIDTLPMVLAAGFRSIERIHVVRTALTWGYGPLLDKFGFGLPEPEFRRRAGSDIVGHLGFEQSLAMVCGALGVVPDLIEADPPEPVVVAEEARRGNFVEVPAGGVAGVRQCARATVGGEPVVTCEGRFGFFSEADGIGGDEIRVTGDGREIVITATPGFESWSTTVAIAANVLEAVTNLAPGLASMSDVPIGAIVPRAGSRKAQEVVAP